MHNILFIIDALGVEKYCGGAQRQFINLVKNLDRLKYFPIIVTSHRNPAWVLKELENVPVYEVIRKKEYDVFYLFKLTKFIKKHEIDLIHSFLNTENIYSRIAGKFSGVRFIITSERSIEFSNFDKIRKYLEYFLSRLSDFIVFNSFQVQQEFLKYIKHSNKSKVIYNGVDFAKLDIIKHKIMLDNKQIKICVVGAIKKSKNQLCLLKAVLSLVSNKYVILFAGQALENNYLERLIDFSKLHNLNVLFLGNRDDTSDIIRESDILVIPSLVEGISNVLLEGMYLKSLIVISRQANNDNIITDSKNGFIFDGNSASDLANKIKFIENLNVEQISVMKKSAHNDVIEKFNLNKMVKENEKLYNHLFYTSEFNI